MLTKPVYYMQTDPKWKNDMYSITGDKAQTIGTSGCGPTSAAMVVQTLRDNGVTPPDACLFAVKNGFRTKDNGTAFAFFAAFMKQFGIECVQTANYDEAVKAIQAGFMVIGRALKGLWTSSGHYILAYGIEGSNILVNDPNSNSAARSKAPLSTFKAQVGPFWIIKEEWKMQESDIRRIVQEELKGLNSAPSAGDLGKEFAEAKKRGITDGSRPQGYATREQCAVMIHRATK